MYLHADRCIDWADFSEWCALHRLKFLPATPQTVALYLTDLARTHKVSTLYRRLSGISQAHQAAGYVTPTTDAQVRLVFQGIRRRLGSAPDQKNAAITAEVRAMVETLSSTSLIGVRDRALLLVGFAGAFRRSELVSLDVADVVFGADGLIVQLRRSKTDQEGEGRKIGAPFGSNPLTCPVRAARLARPCLDRPRANLPCRRSPRQRRGHQADRPVGGTGGETLCESGRAGL